MVVCFPVFHSSAQYLRLLSGQFDNGPAHNHKIVYYCLCVSHTASPAAAGRFTTCDFEGARTHITESNSSQLSCQVSDFFFFLSIRNEKTTKGLPLMTPCICIRDVLRVIFC